MEKSAIRMMVCGDFINKTQPLANQCVAALTQAGVTVFPVNTEIRQSRVGMFLKKITKSLAKLVNLKQPLSDYYVRQERDALLRNVQTVFAQARPDAVLVIRGNHVDSQLLQEMQRQGAVTIGWWIKDLKRIDTLFRDRPFYDIYFCIHESVKEMNVEYLPANAVDRSRFYPLDQRRYAYDVVFVGICTPKRMEYLLPLAKLRLGIVGPGWRTKNLLRTYPLFSSVVARTLHGDELVKFYNSGKIVININQWAATEASGVTLRTADVPACGAFYLTEYSRGLEEVFRLNEEIVTFATPEELLTKVNYYLEHDDEREAIAKAGYARTLQLPTHVDRMRVVLNRIQAHADGV
ncbi:MAG: glycosyltransferase family 1 protein [Magnetococcales bacterium]|nr:glycosyltransferase family 1 protein [Magnetococcales bacterium]